MERGGGVLLFAISVLGGLLSGLVWHHCFLTYVPWRYTDSFSVSYCVKQDIPTYLVFSSSMIFWIRL
jgi:hypothetical protein